MIIVPTLCGGDSETVAAYLQNVYGSRTTNWQTSR